MSIAYLQRLQSERDTLTQLATSLADTAAREDRDVTDTEQASLTQWQSRCGEIDKQLAVFNDQLASQRAYAQLRTDLADAEQDPEPRQLERRTANLPATREWGQVFIESAEFRAYGGRGTMEAVTLPGIYERAPIDSGGIGGLPTLPQTVTVAGPAFPTPLLAACGHMGTNSNVVQWLKDDSPAPPAGVVPEGTPKPEADITLDTETGTLQTYAHWKGITRQALSNLPLIQSIVTNKLRQGIYTKIESDIAALLAAGTFDTVTYGGTGASANVTFLGAIRQAIAEVQVNGFPNANTVLLNPADWAALDVAVMMESVDGPVRMGQFWGLRPVPVAEIPAGTAYVGDTQNAVTVFEQGSASTFMSDSHNDNFIRNVLVILAETMALPLVTQAAALAKVAAGTATAAASGGGGK
jgi:HK97 family phage major capsid protein